jgi:hypothetical protein
LRVTKRASRGLRDVVAGPGMETAVPSQFKKETRGAMALKGASTGDVPVARVACLVVIHGQDLGRIYTLDAPSLVIGRSSKCEIQIDQESISRNHSKVVNTGKSILIRDLA